MSESLPTYFEIPRRRRRAPAKTGTIYFIQAGMGGPVKIGHTRRRVEVRLAYLQTGHYEVLRLIRSVPGTVGQEHALHQHFAEAQIRMEWFRFRPEMLKIDPATLAPAPRLKKQSGRAEFPTPQDGLLAAVYNLCTTDHAAAERSPLKAAPFKGMPLPPTPVWRKRA